MVKPGRRRRIGGALAPLRPILPGSRLRVSGLGIRVTGFGFLVYQLDGGDDGRERDRDKREAPVPGNRFRFRVYGLGYRASCF